MPSRSPAKAETQLPAAGGTRTSAGGTYGDFVPTASAEHDPSRGAEMERDVMGPTADFSRPPPQAGGSDALRRVPNETGAASREERIRAAAFAKYQERHGTGGSDFDDWLAAEREIDGAPGLVPEPDGRTG